MRQLRSYTAVTAPGDIISHIIQPAEVAPQRLHLASASRVPCPSSLPFRHCAVPYMCVQNPRLYCSMYYCTSAFAHRIITVNYSSVACMRSAPTDPQISDCNQLICLFWEKPVYVCLTKVSVTIIDCAYAVSMGKHLMFSAVAGAVMAIDAQVEVLPRYSLLQLGSAPRA